MSAPRLEPAAGPAFDPKGLQDGLRTAERLQVAVELAEDTDIASQVIYVAHPWIKPSAPGGWEIAWTVWTSAGGGIVAEALATGRSFKAASMSEALEQIEAGEDAGRGAMLAAD